ncbi:oxidase [Legionella santicrucis]|uniref:Oxidase n=1 Tax=Legionella santicrucis TaxID=45074 RepID=A0A0W0YJE3_9GAMM|nr:FAD-binding and (Fe-S)-binding domain-containing protein [Legionella santicrucis]KTD57036.1 oxidase [Legionella santicrucis]
MDETALAKELHQHIEGEVQFDAGSKALYATDASNYRQTPIGIVIPKTINDVITTVSICRKYKAPILSRGCGTSLAGQCCNAAIILDFSKYLNKVLEISPEKKLARVQPGCILDNLRNKTEKFQLTFGPDPATHNHITLGGMIGNNSCGVHSVLAQFEGDGARTSDNIESLEILTYDGLRMHVGKNSEEELNELIKQGGRKGEIYKQLKQLAEQHAELIRDKYPKIPRRVSGYNLDELLPEKNFNLARALVGSESTCVIILEATLKLIYSPPIRSLVALGYPDIFSGCDHLNEILKYKPCGLEGLDNALIDFMTIKKIHPEDIQLLPEGKGWLLVEFGGKTKQEADDKAKKLMLELERCTNSPSMKLFDDINEEKKIWEVRESALAATALVPGETHSWAGWEDSAVAPKHLSSYLKELKTLFKKYHYKVAVYGHFGQGCVHCRIPFDFFTAAGINFFRSFLDEAANLVIKYGGSLSGEHGDGQSRGELLEKMYGKKLIDAFREFKLIWDPEWKMNPGKIIEPYKVTENLRIGTSYHPWNPKTYFHFPADDSNFSNTSLRCIGVGVCRRETGGIMCPSYMVTKEEKHSTRGRARLLFEMLRGEVIGKKGWRDKYVKEALDLCLACKGCKKECPAHVDMASYKAEFLSHYYSYRLRPQSAYFLGYINFWSNLAALAPKLVNFLTHSHFFKTIFKFMIGISPKRDIPSYATITFRKWFEQRGIKNFENKQVILWPDTFTNHFNPQIAIASVAILENAGYQVILPKNKLCCGRSLYDYGFLKKARNYLLTILEEMREEIRAGIPIIGLEPSCVAVFKDELCNLLPHDQDAKRLSKQTYLFSEFILKNMNDFALPVFNVEAIVQAHCHQKAVIGLEADKEILKKMQIKFKILDSGCCGMAGSFGYESGEHYEVSIKCGERALFPALENISKEILIIANGFSCRSQIYDKIKIKPLHLAEVIHLAMQQEKNPLNKR